MFERARIRQALASYCPRGLDGAAGQAAVLLPLFVKDGIDHLLLTRRSDHLEKHAGEISFPGGGRHPEDATALETALRETEEEMGIAREDVEVLGRLDDILSIHDICVTPFVGSFPYPYPFQVSDFEIADVIEVPLQDFLDPAVFRSEQWHVRGRDETVHFFTVGGHEVWGLTAAILRQFLQRLGFGPF